MNQAIPKAIKVKEAIASITEEEFHSWALQARTLNPWFTLDFQKKAFAIWKDSLNEKNIIQWLEQYHFDEVHPKTVATVLAGNIPMVGFHDILCVLLSGHTLQVKFSSQDNVVTANILQRINEYLPEWKSRIQAVDKISRVDALIATGTDNTAKQLEYYFKNTPKIIRKNRHSIAILSGKESLEELQKLADDILLYFGLGCRNVSKILLPEGYPFEPLMEAIYTYHEAMTSHHKYMNNYDYNRNIYLMKNIPHLDNGFMLLHENEALGSPIGILYYQYYKTEDDCNNYIIENRDRLQCVLGKDFIPFGESQNPPLHEYADGLDTMKFLLEL